MSLIWGRISPKWQRKSWGVPIELTVRLVIRYGCRIPDVALEVQKSVKDAVEKATACTVTAVHIIVQQLVFGEEDRHG